MQQLEHMNASQNEIQVWKLHIMVMGGDYKYQHLVSNSYDLKCNHEIGQFDQV